MKISEILSQTRFILKDENRNEYSDNELLMYMSGAVDYLSSLLVSARSSYTKKSVTITKSPSALPDDFLSADGIDSGTVIYNTTLTCEKLPYKLVYYSKYKHPKSLDDDLGLPSEFEPIVSQYIVSRALLRNEYSITGEQSADSAFLSAVMEVARLRAGKAATAYRADKYTL